MKGSVKVALGFSIPLLLFGVVFFLLMRFFTRDQLVGVTDEPPIQVTYTSSEIPLDPSSEFWMDINQTNVHLWPQNARVPYGTEERDLTVRAVFNDREIAFHLEFDDDTEDREFQGLTFAMSEDKFDLLKAMVRTFIGEVVKELASDPHPDTIVHCEIANFKLTKLDRSS